MPTLGLHLRLRRELIAAIAAPPNSTSCCKLMPRRSHQKNFVRPPTTGFAKWWLPAGQKKSAFKALFVMG